MLHELILLPDTDGLSNIMKKEGWTGLFRGTSLALFGVSNGAIQFMAYEKMKNFAFAQQKKRLQAEGKGDEIHKLVCAEFLQ
jgi:solute carrier family 25 (mitochondrial folate transporter), member 32